MSEIIIKYMWITDLAMCLHPGLASSSGANYNYSKEYMYLHFSSTSTSDKNVTILRSHISSESTEEKIWKLHSFQLYKLATMMTSTVSSYPSTLYTKFHIF